MEFIATTNCSRFFFRINTYIFVKKYIGINQINRADRQNLKSAGRVTDCERGLLPKTV